MWRDAGLAAAAQSRPCRQAQPARSSAREAALPAQSPPGDAGTGSVRCWAAVPALQSSPGFTPG